MQMYENDLNSFRFALTETRATKLNNRKRFRKPTPNLTEFEYFSDEHVHNWQPFCWGHQFHNN